MIVLDNVTPQIYKAITDSLGITNTSSKGTPVGISAVVPGLSPISIPYLSSVPAPGPSYAPVPAPGPSYAPVPAPGPSYAPVPAPGPSYAPVPAPGPSYAPVPAPGRSYAPAPGPSYAPVPAPGPSYAPVPAPGPSYAPVPALGPSYTPVPAPGPSYVPVPAPASTLTSRQSNTGVSTQVTNYTTTSSFTNIPCTYGTWAPSGIAQVTGCKTGTQTITRPAIDGGKGDCTAPTTSKVPVGIPNTSLCPPCTYGNWTPSGIAPVTGCKTGTQTITRPATDGGKGDCNAPTSITVPIGVTDTSLCPACSYGEWKNDGNPTDTGCKTASQKQIRTATNNGKNDCNEITTQIAIVPSTNTTKCSPCVYGPWQDDGNPTITGCKTASQKQIRTATDNGKGDCTDIINRTINIVTSDTSLCSENCKYGEWQNSGNPVVSGCKTASQKQIRVAKNDVKGICNDTVQIINVPSTNTAQCPPCTYLGDWYSTGITQITGCKKMSIHQEQTLIDNGKGDCDNNKKYRFLENQPSDDTSQCTPCSYGPWQNSRNPIITGCKTASQFQTRTAKDNGRGDCNQPTQQTVDIPTTDTSQCISCNYGPWQNSGNPIITGCKTATQKQTRSIIDRGKGDCDQPVERTIDTPTTDTSQCAPCTYGEWEDNGDPTITGCKTATQKQTRTATDNGKRDCKLPTQQTVNVATSDTSKCTPCTYGSWQNSGGPTITGCRTATQLQKRTAKDNGKGDCDQPVERTNDITTTDTSQCTPCTYGSWQNSGGPTITGCRTATQKQTRTATDNGKKDCNQPTEQTVNIATSDTSKCTPCTYGSWQNSGGPTITGCRTATQKQIRTAKDNGKGDCNQPTQQTVNVATSDTSRCASCTYGSWQNSGGPTITGCRTATQLQTRTAKDNGKGDCNQPTQQTVNVSTSDTSKCGNAKCANCNQSDCNHCTSIRTVKGTQQCKNGRCCVADGDSDPNKGYFVYCRNV